MSAIADAPILKRVKSTMCSDGSKRLADALAKISQLRHRLAEIERDLAEHSKRFSRHVAEKKAQFEASGTFEAEREYILSQVTEEWHRQHAGSPAERARLIYGFNAIGQTVQDEAFGKLATEVPDWRESLATALRLKVQIAEAENERTLKLVREQLRGFDPEEIERDARLRRSRNELKSWERLQERFADAKDLAA